MAVTGVVIERADGTRTDVQARAGVVDHHGGFEWDPKLVKAFLRGPMDGPVSPPNNTGDGLRMAMRVGAELGNMGQAWWVPVVQIPGDTFGGKQRSRSVRLERTRPRSIMVNRYGKRFANEAADYNSLGGPLHHFDANRFEYPNLPAWIVVDRTHLETYGFLGIGAEDEVPEWFNESPDLASLASRIGIDGGGLADTVARWNQHVAALNDPDFQRGQSAYDGCWGDGSKPTLAEKTLGPIEDGPFYAVRITAGAMGTKGGPRDRSRRPGARCRRRADSGLVRRRQRDGRTDGDGLRRCRRHHRPGDGIRPLGRRPRRSLAGPDLAPEPVRPMSTPAEPDASQLYRGLDLTRPDITTAPNSRRFSIAVTSPADGRSPPTNCSHGNARMC